MYKSALTTSTKALISTMNEKGYMVYTRPFELNIVGVRADSIEPALFNDHIHLLFADDKGTFHHYRCEATTDPGTFWLKNPLHQQGTAILQQGQYIAAYQIGWHRGQYEALVQTKPVSVIRDYNRDAWLDFDNGRVQAGLFGINLHRAKVEGTALIVDKNSAGCQVFKYANQFDAFMQRCKWHSSLYGNSFTYTLIDERALARATRRIRMYTVAGVSLTIGTGFLIHQILSHE